MTVGNAGIRLELEWIFRGVYGMVCYGMYGMGTCMLCIHVHDVCMHVCVCRMQACTEPLIPWPNKNRYKPIFTRPLYGGCGSKR